MTRALEIAQDTTGKPFNQLAFDGLVNVPAGGGNADTPLFQAIDAKRAAFGIGKTDPISKVEKEFLDRRNYPNVVLGIAETNTQ